MVKRQIKIYLFPALCALMAALALALLLGLLTAIALQGIPAISWEFLTQPARQFGESGGIVYQIIGTLLLILTAGLISLPLAWGAAVYQAEFLAARWRVPVNVMLYSLNGVPTIIFGLFGYMVFGLYFHLGVSWVTGALILAMMILPTMAISIQQAIRAIPQDYHDTARALGLNQWQRIKAVVAPYSVFGTITGWLLGLARAAGETAAIMFTATAFSGVTLPQSLSEPVTTLQTHLLVLSQDALSPAARTNAWGAALVLVMIVFSLNITSMFIRKHVNLKDAR